MKLRFVKTHYGWKAFRKYRNAYFYVGHFATQRAAREALEISV